MVSSKALHVHSKLTGFVQHVQSTAKLTSSRLRSAQPTRTLRVPLVMDVQQESSMTVDVLGLQTQYARNVIHAKQESIRVVVVMAQWTLCVLIVAHVLIILKQKCLVDLQMT